ncbi:nucleoside-diphosphate sugar epimerase [Leptospira ilyithenensis]|uniref:Nucleoside-diphosphate sugar epimerase n=1 Tax=Leptospira ilyithenensis TaxID=2484901 RepID=A0A4R9LTZ8_9LEPT|nr:nucleoside-diphosphate sugar epimerase [Leptospira ilyithenensis]TGN14263.1 nucleoside-diphosphate sugar epimerase [Leptospira ilyithenensis]
MSGYKVLLLGGTGLVGSEVLKVLPLFKEVKKVFVWARIENPSNTESPIEIQAVTWESFSSGKVRIPKGIDAVICCLGTTIAKAGTQEKFKEVDYEYPLLAGRKAKEAGVPAFLIVTAMGANSGSFVFYNRVKGEIENALIGLKFPYLGIFRPSVLVGDRKETRIGEKMAEAIATIIPFSLIGMRKYKPIPAQFVAVSLLKSLIAGLGKIKETNTPKLEIIESDQMLDLGKGL